ncbi:MAG: AraC family transcriptional regulator [Romboutsia sp.]
MDKLKEVLNDFYCCLSIPIHFVNKDFKVIIEKGYNMDSHRFLKHSTIYDDIKKNSLSIINLTYFKNIHFIVMPILNFNLCSGYIIIGPFRSENICSELNIPFKPFYCIDYISTILKNISDKKLNIEGTLSQHTKKSIDYIHNNYTLDIKIDDICSYLNLNKSYFCSIFKKETGYTFTNFLNKIRIERSKEILLNEDLSILDVALSVGFNNHNYFTTTFKKFNNKTPLEYKNSLRSGYYL